MVFAHGRRHSTQSVVNVLARHEEVRDAWSVSCDADCVRAIVTRDLAAFRRLHPPQLPPHPQVAQVRSEIVLKALKAETGLPIG